MRRLPLLGILLLAALLVGATIVADIQIDAPMTAMPGETITATVTTEIGGVRVISVPTAMTVTWPDGATSRPSLKSDGQGGYSTQLYLPREGTYVLEATATLGEGAHTANHTVTVQKPGYQGTITANQTHIHVESPLEQRYAITLAEPAPGPLAELSGETCAAILTTGDIPCPVGGRLAVIQASGTYTHTLLRTAHTRPAILIPPGEPLSTDGALLLRGDALIALGPETVLQENATLIRSDEQGAYIQPVTVLGAAQTVNATAAYDAQTGTWYARYDGPATGELRPDIDGATIEEAWSLTGQRLRNTPATVIAQSGFEARLSLVRKAPAMPSITRTQDGTAITADTEVTYRLPAEGTPVQQGMVLATHTAPDGIPYYYATGSHVVLAATPGQLLPTAGVAPVLRGQPLNFTLPDAATSLRILDESLRVIAVRPAGDVSWTPSVAPGTYYALAVANGSVFQAFEVFSAEGLIGVDAAQNVTGLPNTQVAITHTITNHDWEQARTIDVAVTSPYAVLLEDAAGNRLTDTNLNGIPDTGLLAPGDQKAITAYVLLPPDAQTSTLSWRLASDEQRAGVNDTIALAADAVPLVSNDAAVGRLAADGRTLEATLFNLDAEARAVEISFTTHTPQGPDESRYTVTLAPGEQRERFTIPAQAQQVSVRILTADDDSTNDVRTARLATRGARLVWASEQQHLDHEAFSVKASVPTGSWQALYPDAAGTLQQAALTTLTTEGGRQDVLIRLPISASTDVPISLVPGASAAIDPYLYLDNNDPAVRSDGQWYPASQVPGFWGADYLTDLGSEKGDKSVRFAAPAREADYEVSVWYPGDAAFASNARMIIGEQTILLDQRQPAEWKYVGRYRLGSDAPVAISNAAADGMVVADALRLLRVDQYASLVRSQELPEQPRASAMIYNSRGEEVLADVSLRQNGQLKKGGLLPSQARSNEGPHQILFSFTRGSVRSILVHDADPSTMRLGYEPIPNAHAQRFTQRNVVDAYAINPGFASNYTVTKVAVGRQLLKCTAYNFTTQDCYGGFEVVRSLTPGQTYSVTFTPEDPLTIEVDDEIIPPIYATCSATGTYSPSNCQGTYDGTPSCADEHIYCDEPINTTDKEAWSFQRAQVAGIVANYSDLTIDPVEECDTIKDVWLDYQVWEGGPDYGADYNIFIDADGNGFTQVASGSLNGEPGTVSSVQINNTAGESWECADFFGDYAGARVMVNSTVGTGSWSNTYSLHVDYLALRLDYNWTAQSIETNRSSYAQGETVNMYGEDLWDASVNVTINITRAGTFVGQTSAITNGSGYFTASYTLDDYAPLGGYDLYAWQPNNASKNATNNFTVTRRAPTISTDRVGDYFNRSEVVTFSGTAWAKSTNVTINVTNPEGDVYPLTPDANLSAATGTFTYHWPIPDELDMLTGPYKFDFREQVNESYGVNKTVYVVILPESAVDIDANDRSVAIYGLDNDFASFADDNGLLEWIRIEYPEAVPSQGASISLVRLEFFHRESGDAAESDLTVDWLNKTSNTWSTVCGYEVSNVNTWDVCDLTSVARNPTVANNLSIRITDNGTDVWPGGSTFRQDIAFLNVNFTFPPPNVSLVSPGNDTWFSSAAQSLVYNATDDYYGVSACRVYVDGALAYTNASFVVNTTDTYSDAFSEGNRSWYVACDDNSTRALTGYSETRSFMIDLTDPNVTIDVPATNYTWHNTSTPTINFTLRDNLDALIEWWLYVDGSLDAWGNATNASLTSQALSAQPDGLHNVTVEARDESGRYAQNRSVLLYVDTTSPSVTLNAPPVWHNTTQTTIAFNWTASDNLDSALACDLLIDGAYNDSDSTTSGSTSQLSVNGFADGYHNWSVTCTDEATNTFSTAARNFTVDTTAPAVNLESPDGTLFATTRNLTLRYNVTDLYLPVDSCVLYVDDAYNQTNNTVAEGVSQNFSLSDVPNGFYLWNVACNDTVGNAINSTQWNFTVNVSVLTVSPANGTPVDRDSGNAGVSDTVTVVARVGDAISGVPISFYAQATGPIAQGPFLVGSDVTNASGHASFTIDPDPTVHAGNWTWWGQAPGYSTLDDRYVHIYGTPGVAFQDAALDPNSEYNATQTVGLNATVTSPGETSAQLDTVYGLWINATLTPPTDPFVYIRLEGQGALNGSYFLPVDAEIGLWNATYNTSASWFYMNSTDGTRQFTVKGFANTISPANGTVVDRDGAGADPETLPLVVRIPGASAGETVNFTLDLIDPVISGQSGIRVGSNTTNASGHATLWFDPNSTLYAGNYTWYGISDVSFVNATSTLVIKGGLAPARSHPSIDPNSTYFQNDTATFRYDVTNAAGRETPAELASDYGLTVNVTFKPNTTGSPVYVPSLSWNSVNWSGSQQIGLTDPVENWSVQANASGPYHYANQSVVSYAEVHGLANLTLADETDTLTRYVYELVNFTANYSDTLAAPITGASCRIRFDIAGGYTPYVDMDYAAGLYWYNRSFTETYAGADFNVHCQHPLYQERNETSTFTVTRTTASMHTPNGTLIDRDAASASDPDTLLLNASIPSAPAGVTIEFRANLTQPALGQTDVLLGSAVTAADGHATLSWNPAATLYAGNWTLWANSTYADPGTASDAELHGLLATVFASATAEPDASYTQNGTAVVRANATSPGPETPANLDAAYALSYTAYLASLNGQDSFALGFTDPNWSQSYSLLTLAGVGVWNVSANATAGYHYANATNRTFTVYGFMNVTDSTLSPSQHYVYGSATQECRVRDQHTGVVVPGANVSFYRDSTFVGSSLTNASGWASVTFQTNVSSTYSITCNVSDQLGIHYYAGDDASNVDSLQVDPFPITPTSPNNGTQVDRDGVDGGVADFLTLNVSVPGYVPDGVGITFYGNATSPLAQGPVLLGSAVVSSGYAAITYNPSAATRAGDWSWWAENSSGSPNGTRTFESLGDLSLAFRNTTWSPDANYTQNETATLRFNLTGLGPETRSELNASHSAGIDFVLTSSNGQDSTLTAFVDPYWEGSYALLSLAGVGVWNVSANASADHFFADSVAARNFTVYGYMNVTDSILTPASVYAYQQNTHACRVRDQHTGVAVQGANVSFYRDSAFVGSALTNSTGWASATFQTNVSGSYAVTCNVSDQLGIYYYAGDDAQNQDALTVTPFPITPTSPNNGSQVDRDGASGSIDDTVTLNVTVPAEVEDGATILFYSNLTDPLTQGAILLGSNTTSGGSAHLTIDPNASVFAGEHTWFANSSSGTQNGTRTYEVVGSLLITHASDAANPDANYTQNETAALRYNLTSPGPESRSEISSAYGAAMDFSVVSVNGADSGSAAFVDPYWEGSYALLALAGIGVWNSSANASAQYFLAESFTGRNFTVYGFMNVTDSTLSPSQHYVYGSATQECRVRDQHTGVAVPGANVSFYRDATLVGTALTNATGWASVTFQTNVSSAYSITCNVSDQLGIYYYAGDDASNVDSLQVDPFPITPVAPANGSLVDRDGVDAGTPDFLILNVSVPGYVPDGTGITFYGNATAPVTQGPVLLGSTVVSSGYASISYNPSAATRAGNWSWWAQNSSGSPNGTRSFLSYGSLSLAFWNATWSPDANYTQNETATLRSNLTGPGPESRGDLNASHGGGVDFSLVSVNGGDSTAATYIDPYWQGTYSLLSLAGVGVWNVSANASAEYFFNDSVSGRNFTVYGFMNVTDSTLSPATVYAYQQSTQECRVQDQHTGVAVQGANVSFYRDSTFVGSSLTNSTGWASATFQTNVSGSYTVTCNVTDQLGIYYYAGDDAQNQDALTVNPYPITPTGPTNATQVDRDGASAGIPDAIALNVSVPAEVADGVAISFYSNLTSPLTQASVLLGSNTTSSGQAVLWYDPNATSYAGEHTWFANSSSGAPNGTRTYHEIGSLLITHAADAANPDANYTQNETAALRYNLTSPGPESRSEISSAYGAAMDFSVVSVNGADSGSAAFVNPYWEGSYALLTLAGIGVWNSSANASAQYFLAESFTGRNFTVYGFMNVTDSTLSPSSIYSYQYATQTCRVQDQHTGVAVQGANVSFYRNSTFVGTNLTDASGWATLSFATNTSGSYIVTCNVSDQPAIHYYAGDDAQNQDALTVNPFPVTPVAPANNTQVDRDDVSGALPNAIRLNVSVPGYVPDGTTITFSANATTPLTQGPLVLGSNTTSGGYAVLYYDPNASTRAGEWTWWGENSEGGANGTRAFESYGSLALAFRNVTWSPDANYTQNETATLRLNLTSPGPETRSELSAAHSGGVDFTLQSSNGQDSGASAFIDPYWEASYALLSLAGVGVWNASGNASAEYFFDASLSGRNFTVYGYANITDLSLSRGVVPVFDTLTASCRLRDQHTGVAVQGATISFYENGTLHGTDVTNASGWADYVMQLNTTGTRGITCAYADDLSIYYYAGDEPNASTDATVTPYLINATSPVNGTRIDRDGVLSYPDLVLLVAQAESSIPAGRTFEFRANITDPALGITEQVLGSNTTNSSGAAVLSWNPNSTMYAGEWTWWAVDAGAGEPNEVRSVKVMGGLNVTFADAGSFPNATYDKRANVSVHAVLDSYGPENRSVLDASYAAAANVTFFIPNSSSQTVSLTFNGSAHTGWLDILRPEPQGLWRTALNASAQYFEIVAAQNRTFWVNNIPPNQTAPTLTSTTLNNWTNETLTVENQSTSDEEGDAVVTTYDWRVDGASIASYRFAFDSNVSANDSGAVRDYTDASRDATLGGGNVSLLPTWSPLGVRGGSYMFDGSGEWVSLPDRGQRSDPFTVELWVRPDALTGNLFEERMNAGDRAVFLEAGQLGFGWWSLADGTQEVLGGSLATGVWQHVAAVWDGTQQWIYVNGSLVGNRTPPGGPASGTYYWTGLGRADTGGAWSGGLDSAYSGRIDDVVVYNRSLSAEQLLRSFEEGRDNLSSRSIVSNETAKGESWTACATPNDLWDDGPTLCSNAIVVQGLLQTVSPVNDSVLDRDGGSVADPDARNLSVSTFGDPGEPVSFFAALTDPALGPTSVLLGTATSNLSGIAVLEFNPNESLRAGNWTWWPASTNSTTIDNRSVIIRGNLSLAFQDASVDPDAAYNKTQSARFNATLQSPGPETASELANNYSSSVNGTLTPPTRLARDFVLSYAAGVWSGTSLLDANEELGLWNASLSAVADYHYADARSARNFTVYGKMNLTDSTLQPQIIYVYGATTHRCRVQDEDNSSDVSGANVTFYRNATLLGTNITNASGWAQYSFQVNSSGSYNVTCTIADQLDIYYYAGAQRENTLNVTPYPIMPVSPANGTLVDRDGGSASIDDVIILNVSVPSYVPDGILITFEANHSDPALGGNAVLGSNATSSGRAQLFYNPNSSSYVGLHEWYAVADSGDPNATATYRSIGTPLLSFRNDSWSPDANYTQNETALLRSNLTSPGPESRSQVAQNYSGWVNYSLTSMNGAAGGAKSFVGPYWETTYSLLSLAGVGVWNVSLSASADDFLNASAARNFTVYGFMNVTDSTLSPSSIYSYEVSSQECRVRDQHTGFAVQGANVSFYRNATLVGTNLTNASGWATLSFVTNTSGSYTVTCNVSDQLGIYYYAGDDASNQDSLSVSPFPVTPIAPANGTAVDRDAANATMDDVVVLTVSVPASVPDGVPITFYGNATSPVAQGPLALGSNVTASGGGVLYYDPNASTRMGEWTWWGENSEGGQNGTRSFESWGALSLSFADNAAWPDASYFQNETVEARLNLTVPGPESRSELSSAFSAGVDFTVTGPNGASLNQTAFVDPFWQGYYGLLDLAGVGVWNVSGNSSAEYSFGDTVADRNFTVYGYANVTDISASPSPLPVFSTVTVECRVRDQHTGVSVAGGEVSFLWNGTWMGNATTNASGHATRSFSLNTTGSFNLSCLYADQPAIFYYAGDSPNATAVLNVTPYRINPSAPTNGTIVDRDNVSSDPDVLLLVAQAASAIPAGRTFEFRANITDPALGITEQVLGSNTTNSSGAAILYWNPNSSMFAGDWTWWALDAGAGDANRTASLQVFGGLNISFADASVDPDASYNQSDVVAVNASLSSFGPENASVLNASYGSLVNASLVPPVSASQTIDLSFAEPKHTGSYALPLTADVGVWDVWLNASAAYFYFADVDDRNLSVYGLSNLSLRDSSETETVRMFQVARFFANYSDTADQPINATTTMCRVRYDYNGSWTGYTNMTFNASLGEWTHNRTFDDWGNFTFNVHCDAPWYAAQNVTDWFIINKTAINSVFPLNNSIIDRDGYSASFDETQRLVAYVDSEVAGISVTFKAWLVDPALGILQNVTIGTNLTEASGNVTLWWNPNASFYAGNYRWGGEATNAEPNETLRVHVYGGLNGTYASAIHPNASYNQSQDVEFVANLSTPGPENASLLNSTYLVVYNHTTTKPSGLAYSQALVFDGTRWTGNYTLNLTDEPGAWNTSHNVSAQYFFDDAESLRSFAVWGTTLLDVFDEQDRYGYRTYAGHDAYHLANWTDLAGAPVTAGNCTLSLYNGTNLSMAYNPSTTFWERDAPYRFEASVAYGVLCQRPYYWNMSEADNLTVQSVVDLNASYGFMSTGGDSWRIVLDAQNLQDYTEHNVSLYAVLGPGLTPTYSVAPTETVLTADGLALRWYWENFTAFESREVVINVTGSGDWRIVPSLAISSPSTSGVWY